MTITGEIWVTVDTDTSPWAVPTGVVGVRHQVRRDAQALGKSSRAREPAHAPAYVARPLHHASR